MKISNISRTINNSDTHKEQKMFIIKNTQTCIHVFQITPILTLDVPSELSNKKKNHVFLCFPCNILQPIKKNSCRIKKVSNYMIDFCTKFQQKILIYNWDTCNFFYPRWSPWTNGNQQYLQNLNNLNTL